MIELTTGTLLAVFLIFCRIGGCLMIAPGLSSPRVPVQVRLFIALSVSLALTPLLIGKIGLDLSSQAPARLLWLILSEGLTGLLIGLLGRIYFFGLQTLATGAAMAIGFGGIAGAPVDDTEPLPAMGSLIVMVATALLFLSDLHWEIIRGLVDSYGRLPVGDAFRAQPSLVQVVDNVEAAFILALRITSPFILYSVIVNLAVGLTNKLTPQIPVYFIATPFVLFGGLLLMYFLFNDYMLLFVDAFSSWLKHG